MAPPRNHPPAPSSGHWPALPVGLALLLGGCVEAALGPAAAVGGASLILTGRTPVDQLASLASGLDCSVVRLERRQSWCAPAPAPLAPVYCTRTLGAVDCWMAPPAGSRQVADPPAAPVPASPAAAPPLVLNPAPPAP
jgi:hypothetical protein